MELSDFGKLPNGRFERAVYELLLSEGSVRPDFVEQDVVALVVDGRLLVCARYRPREQNPDGDKPFSDNALEGRVLALLERALRLSEKMPVQFLVVGGSDALFARMEEAVPESNSRVSVYHWAETGEVFGGAGRTLYDVVRPALARAGKRAAEAPDWKKLAQRLAGSEGDLDLKFMRQRKPRVTYALLVLIGFVFALELLFGAMEAPSVLSYMGALVPERVVAGEWWRLASATVLHGGWLHLAFNGYVLFALGRFLERFLGSARFTLLYVVSGVVASLGSMLLLGSMSVGASGAIWGLLGAQAAIAFHPSIPLPPAMRRGLKQAAAFNLAINVVNSFRPMVDWAAHFTGGAAGALLIFSGLLLRGVAWAPGEKPDPQISRKWSKLALVSAVLYTGVALYGVVASAPWQLRQEVRYETRASELLKTTLGVPSFLPPGRSEQDGARQIEVFGDPAGPLRIMVTSAPLSSPVTIGELPGNLDTVRASFASPPDGAELVEPPRVTQVDGIGTVRARYRLKDGTLHERLVRVRAGAPRFVRVEAMIWPTFEDQYPDVTSRLLAPSELP